MNDRLLEAWAEARDQRDARAMLAGVAVAVPLVLSTLLLLTRCAS